MERYQFGKVVYSKMVCKTCWLVAWWHPGRVTKTEHRRLLHSAVDLNAILADLRQQHAQVSTAILAIELLATSGKRRGRPPGKKRVKVG